MAEDKPKFNLPELEEKILKFWEENKIFEKSLERTKKGKTFVFYEGPPTANGLPGVHHAETRAFKDVILRYKTMRGFFVPRKAGWDTHGLPVEIEVEKALGFKTKQDIERYGIDKFNKKAQESVWQYKAEWEQATRRLGFWLDLEHPYITYETSYIESLWWIIKEIWKKGLLYKDFKVVPWCPRCQTGLSSHELGLGYKKIKEDAIYVKMKIKSRRNEYLLVWTTTPWTLPANVAVAIHPRLDYTKWKFSAVGGSASGGKVDEEFIWSLRAPPADKGQKIDVVERASGKSLLGLGYEPLFQYQKEYLRGNPPDYITIPGEFISTEEGTGMVHIAPAFGDEDMNAARARWKDEYPLLHTVNADGTMKKGVIGEGKFAKDADRIIIDDLRRRNLLLRVEQHEHDYPFCWRCSAPLLYFARTAWWIKMSTLREKLLANNEKINWIPEHIKHGRFGGFLKEVRDWAFSRERYWGTPLPVWECTKCKKQDVLGSREEIASRGRESRNRYFIMRHGEALTNIKNVISYTREGRFNLTVRGRVQAEQSAQKLKREHIDVIFASDILRTKETAEIIAKTLGIKKVNFDERLHEVNTGIFAGRRPDEYSKYFSSRLEKFTKRPPEGETLTELRKRAMEFLEDVEKKYSGKKILIVSHEYPLWMLYTGAGGFTNEEAVRFKEARPREDFIGLAEVMEMPYRNLPRDETGAVNLHRPYVDYFELPCAHCGSVMKRIPEVVDVWFDSGAMPFAQEHWPFNKKLAFPADYIVEAVDQTRGWFYTLLAVATLLGRGAPYRNVISVGHVLDKNGQKMSKSKGNVVDPGAMIQKYGADALRWYFYTINAPGEPKRFDEKDLFNSLRNFLGTLWNSFLLFDTYVDKIQNSKFKIQNSDNVLDRWVLAKLNVLIREVTRKLDSYDITGAARLIEEFTINDFSQWYLRRSRRRFQHPRSAQEKEEVVVSTARVILELCEISAPFVPFLSDSIYREMRKKLNFQEMSVHLAEWPKVKSKIKNQKSKILDDMQIVRGIVAAALKLRAEAGIKVRQPLAKLQIKNEVLDGLEQYSSSKRSASRSYLNELLELIKDEVNVKEIVFGDELKLDIKITPELKEEGMAREIIRNIQEMRKDLGLKPRDKIRLQFLGPEDARAVVERRRKMIVAETGAKKFAAGEKKIFRIEREMDLAGERLRIGIY